MSDVNNRILSVVKQTIPQNELQIDTLKPDTLSIRTRPGMVIPTIKAILTTSDEATLSTISSVDLNDRFELLYHLRTLGTIATVRCEIPSKDPRITSITPFIPGANFAEREATDFLGIEFEEHPDPSRLMVPDAWPKDLYPKCLHLKQSLRTSPLRKQIQNQMVQRK